ncbi:MAG: hypothetical protein QOG56_545 [Solirubrobacteraceae bacterium]|nr:hypothetical protein [Solirubrobacteraceae bacterium]
MRPYVDTIAAIAARQHGRIAHAQLLAAGLDRDRIKRWCRDGRLRRVHREVYALGHTAPSELADVVAAVLACGAGAAASHRSAAHMLVLLPVQPRRPEVTVPTTAGRDRPGIVVHRVANLDPRDVKRVHRIPTTTPARTLLDLTPSLAPHELGRACHEAWVRHRTSAAQIEACIARNPTKKGAAKLRRALGADVTLSALEDGFLVLLERHGLPRPRTNIDRRGDKVDCHWPRHDLVVELLSYRFHASRRAFEADVARRRRSNHVAYTYGDVFERGDRTAAELARRLGADRTS